MTINSSEEKHFIGGFLQFSGLVRYHHGRKHGGRPVGGGEGAESSTSRVMAAGREQPLALARASETSKPT